MEEKQNSAVAVRKEEAMMNQLKKSVDLVIPSSVQDRELFAQNCMLYLAEVNAKINLLPMPPYGLSALQSVLPT